MDYTAYVGARMQKRIGALVNPASSPLWTVQDYGTETCGGYPGTLNHTQQDANTIAAWGVDAWKMDGCYNPDIAAMPAGYMAFEQLLNETGRPILFSCSWPAYCACATEEYSGIASPARMMR